ncbi:HD domain-containing protein [Ornithinibacillus scapharcae]|uniref:HD domain-containing protein n=1 Tax=Ornithinibacillus scapharcae TaxID=1147159 RepID=UPI000225BF4B|nr:HD domain-containing protein [Ornithinibacillus scapharcae]
MREKAREFATKAHAGQKRKNSNDDYITHPIRVAERLEREGFSDELVCAGYLHDVVEDTIYEREDIERLFGIKVADMVAAHTEDKSKSWKDRKQHTIDTIKQADKEIKYLIVADKLDNLIGLERDLKMLGPSVWKNFNAGIEEQKWYNESIAQYMKNGLHEHEIPAYFLEYENLVKKVFG